MKKPYILALDQGTTSSKALLYDVRIKQVVAMASSPLRQIYPRPGWVEHDANEIWTGQLEAAKNVIAQAGIETSAIACIGIANQRETVVVWDKKTGEPIHPAVVWQCRRTAQMCEELKAEGLEDTIRGKTGLVIDAYFSGTKIRWLLEHVPGARARADRGELLAGTMDTWLVWNLTGGRVHATDYSNASRTMLFNINTLDWDKELLYQMDVPRNLLPWVVPSSGLIGRTSKSIFGDSIPISGMAGDQQAALFGQACFQVGSAKNTYGTGCFILMNVGSHPVPSRHRLLTTIAWVIEGEVAYALEGSVFNAGSAIQWLRDEMGLIKSADESGPEAEQVPDTGGVYVVPAFTGLGAPYWDMYARGIICGITRGTNRRHIIRATLESIAYQSRDVLEAMQLDSGIKLSELKVDGGASACDFLMQFQADMLAIPVLRPKIAETTVLGAIYLAGLGVKLWKSKQELQAQWVEDAAFMPGQDPAWIHQRVMGWNKAVRCAGSGE